MKDLNELYDLYQAHPEVFTDSRKIKPGGIFFALKGERFDGNRFARQALDAGAAYAVVDDPSVATTDRMILVKNSLVTLQDLARHHRRQFDVPFIGITGSNGKTTTKELVSGVLAKKYRTFFTQGNLNNHIGVPLTILSIPKTAEMVVVEMGANHQGEIGFLSTISQPSHGLITNIGKAHLEGFGGIEGVKKGKSELYRFLAETDGIVFINTNERFLEELAAPVRQKVFYGKTEQAVFSKKDDYQFQLVSADPFVKVEFAAFTGEAYLVHSQLPGAYNFGNIITAIALGLYFELAPSDILEAVEAYVPQNNRSQILQKGSNTIVLDAYNANPTSMREALINFGKMEGDRKIAILGDMLEMGEYAEAEHRAIFEQAQELPLEQLVLVGPEFARFQEPSVLYFKDVDELKPWWREQSFEDACILIKGSRSIGLERILQPSAAEQ